MRAGSLDKEITIERAITTLNTVGVPQTTWATLATMRAQLVQAGTDEFIRDYGASSETVIVFRTRWLDDVTVADRVSYEGRKHDIKQVKELGRRKGLELRTVALGAT